MNEQSISELIDAKRDELAEAIIEKIYLTHPQLERKYGRSGRGKCLQDTVYHLQYLTEAMSTAAPLLFQEYIAWAKVMLSSRHVPPDDLKLNLELIRDVLQAHLPVAGWLIAAPYLDGALARFPDQPETLASFIAPESPLYELATDYLNALLRGDRQAASRFILDAVNRGIGVKDIYLHVFQPCQHEVGRLWQMNEVSVAQEHFCTAATQLIMSQLYPHIFATVKTGRCLVATAVGGELHEIGVRMVADFLEMEGWDTYYLGGNMPAESIVRSLKDRHADVVAISATISSRVSKVTELIDAIRSASSQPPVKILVGGYPFNIAEGLWQRVGADGYARNAQEAGTVALRLLEETR